MDFKLFLMVFGTIFVAEIGDKTQLATLLYAADAQHAKLTVFIASALALVLASALGVMAGGLVARYIDPKILSWIAGCGFIIIGTWTLVRA